MKKHAICNRDITLLCRWMRDIAWADLYSGREEHLTGARLLIWARIWTLSQDNAYGVRAADIGAWACLGKSAAAETLAYMVDHKLLERVPMVQGYGYTAVGPKRDQDSDDEIEVRGWMVTQLGLRTATEIIAYAIIYCNRHRRDGYYGSPKYIADWAGVELRAVQYALARLQDATRHGGPLVLTHSCVDRYGRTRLARKPNSDIYIGWVERTRQETRNVAPGVFDQIVADRRKGHRSVERHYRQRIEAIANDLMGLKAGTWTE